MIKSLLKFSILTLLIGVVIQVRTDPYIIVNRWDEDIPLYNEVTKTPYKNCGGSESIVKSVEVVPCNAQNSDTCVIKRGDDVKFHLSFVSNVNSTSLQAKIYGIYDYIPVPFPCPQPDACKDSGIICPIKNKELYNYTLEAQTLETYPKMSLWVKGELKDDREKILVCVKIYVKLI